MRRNLRQLSVFLVAALLALSGCAPQKGATGEFKIDYAQYTLDNGLEVILHEDRSDPIVAVALQFHVGSNREVPGRTGFAHLFEHMMFQESQHVGQDQFFKKIQAAGGTLNGGTSRDGTIYFEVLPKNALELALWLESDRLGYLRSTITQDAFANQQGVVKNEKRQGVDNRPYGYTSYIIGKLLYPEDHPYNWQVIGSMEDLTNATLKDVHQFHETWYRPNNCTLVVAGDFDGAETRALIEKYFGEIPGGSKLEAPESQPVPLEASKLAFHEDSFARSPELSMVFPTVEQYHPDAYPLSFLGQLLSFSKKAPMYQIIVEEKKLASRASGYQRSSEIAGEFMIRIPAFPKVDLNDVTAAISETFERFETESFTEQDVERIKAGIETGFYNGLSSILGKSFQLARYNEYAGSPDYLATDLEKIQAVTKADILRVYEKYIKDKPYVMTCFVPKGQTDLVVQGAERFPIKEESITAEETSAASVEEFTAEPSPSSFDRGIEPAVGTDPEVTLPTVWRETLGNGMEIYGIEHHELPLIQFTVTVNGGQLLDDFDQVGVANLVSDLLMEGTLNKTPIELEEAIDDLGASIMMYTGREAITLRANCLSSKFTDVFALIEEILLEPRWDAKEFERIKRETLESINRNKANPNAIASNVFNDLTYGEKHIFRYPTVGTTDSVESISLEDVKTYYTTHFSPSVAHVAIAGNISRAEAVRTFKPLEYKWPARDVVFPDFPLPEPRDAAMVCFVDVPNAKQSVIRIGSLGLAYTDADYYPAYVMNYKLGGSFNSIVNMILREEKGYTYGARSGFSGSRLPGTFAASSSVQSRVTLESVQIFRDSMTGYREGISADDLAFTKSALLKSNALRFETLGSLIGMLNTMGNYGFPADYIKQQEAVVRGMTLDRHRELARKYIEPGKMVYLVVGDAATQMKGLEQLGLGKPVLIENK